MEKPKEEEGRKKKEIVRGNWSGGVGGRGDHFLVLVSNSLDV